jgi:hypothetical protein
MPIELTKISRFRPTACMASMIVRACCGISSARFAWTTSWLGIAARGARIEYIAFDDFLPNGARIPEPACLSQKKLKGNVGLLKERPASCCAQAGRSRRGRFCRSLSPHLRPPFSTRSSPAPSAPFPPGRAVLSKRRKRDDTKKARGWRDQSPEAA